MSKATLGKLQRDGVERIIMGVSERIDTILNSTQLNCHGHCFFKACFCPFREWVPLTCPAGLHFDTSISTCNWPAAANCGTCVHFLLCSVSCGPLCSLLALAVSCSTCVHFLPWLSAVLFVFSSCSALSAVVRCVHILPWLSAVVHVLTSCPGC